MARNSGLSQLKINHVYLTLSDARFSRRACQRGTRAVSDSEQRCASGPPTGSRCDRVDGRLNPAVRRLGSDGGERGQRRAQPPADPRVTGGLRGTADAAGQQQTPDDPAGVAPADAAAPTGSPGESGPVINYGRPTPKKPKLFTPKSPLLAPNPRSLPPLMRYPTAPGTKKRNSNPPQNSVTPADAASTAAAAAAAGTATPQDTPGPTVAVVPWNKPPLRPKLDDKPFDPLGIDAGSLRLFPFVETSVGYDSNPIGSPPR